MNEALRSGAKLASRWDPQIIAARWGEAATKAPSAMVTVLSRSFVAIEYICLRVQLVVCRFTRQSELELKSQLHQARRHRADDLSEGRIIDVAVNRVRAEELGMIEGIERFQTEFEHFGFSEFGIFQQSNVPIVHSWSIRETARGRAGQAERWKVEERCIEIGLAVSWIVIELQRAG